MFDEGDLPPDPLPGEPWPTPHWYAVWPSDELGRRRSVGLRRLGRELVLWRDAEGVARCAPRACPHRGAPLGPARVVEGALECPLHGFRFGGDGACVAMPCEGPDAVIPARLGLHLASVREEAGFIWLWAGVGEGARVPVPWLEALDADGARATGSMVWRIRMTRVAEQMLDLHHTAHAHRRVMGSAYRVLDPFHAVVEGGTVQAEGRLRREGGGGVVVALGAAFPGVFRIALAGTQIEVFLCPIDGEFTWIGFRYLVPVPVLGGLLARLAVWFELNLVQTDDWRLGKATRPRSVAPGASTLVRADRAVALYQRLWNQAMAKEQHAAEGISPSASG